MRTALFKTCSCAAGLACLVAVSSAKAEIIFCNEFPHLVYVAMAYPQDEGSWISRGWLALKTGECSLFDTALRVKTFYFRGESERYRDASRRRTKMNWGAGRSFAIWEASNFNYWNAQTKVLNSSLADFTQGPVTTGDAVSAKVTFTDNGSRVEFKSK
jgi:uncharacterized membrane protein